jgi:hypothetical protein
VSKPEGLFLVTDDGRRIPIDVKLAYVQDGERFWSPVIEGDLNAIMPSVIAIDGPPVHDGEVITFADPGPGWETDEWGERVMANSGHVFGHYDRPDLDQSSTK